MLVYIQRHNRMLKSIFILVTLLMVLPSAVHATPLNQAGVQVLNEYPHDSDAFTQGLLLKDGLAVILMQ